MIPPQYGYMIGYGHNLPLGSLTNWEALQAGGKYFYPPNAYPAFNPGTFRLRVDGQNYNTGFPSADWHLDTFFRPQYQLTQASYTVGGNSFSGDVSIVTYNTAGTLTKYNAVMILPTLPTLERNFTAYRNVVIKMTRLSLNTV